MTEVVPLDSLQGKRVLVTGWGVTGRALIEPLRELGAHITVSDGSPSAAVEAQARHVSFATADELTADGGLDGVELVVTSPGWRPDSPVLSAAAACDIPIWGDVEFAWRVDQAQLYGPTTRWLVVTGTNGKTTTTSMLESILTAAGIPNAACGNIGLPVLAALRSEPRPEVLAVELSSFQLYWAPSVHPDAGVVLNIAEDHLDWHGGMDGYVDAKRQALTGKVGVIGLDDAVAAGLAAGSPAGRTVGFRLGEPEQNELGVWGGHLLDRAFGDDEVLAPIAEITPAGPAGVMDALAAAALARSIGIEPGAVRRGLRSFTVGPHRAARVRELSEVSFVDDSKATNPHAARSSILAHPSVVWVAGGLLKGAQVDDLVREVADRLVGAVLIGRDAAQIAEALARHAPDVPVVGVRARDDAVVTDVADVTKTVDSTVDSDAVMAEAVRQAARLARPGDTVLLAPAAASLDMFDNYGQRGDSFAAAVRTLQSDDISRLPR